MIIDITGTVLTPGNMGRNCMGNGTNPEAECCCDECDYMMCRMEEHDPMECLSCNDRNCPNVRGD